MSRRPAVFVETERAGGGEEPYSCTATTPDAGIAKVSAKNAGLLARAVLRDPRREPRAALAGLACVAPVARSMRPRTAMATATAAAGLASRAGSRGASSLCRSRKPVS